MIEIDNAVIERGTFRLSVSLTVPAGSICAIVGPSGGGKSTLLESIAGFLPLTAGTIRVAGVDLAGQEPGARPVTLLFQENNLFPHLSIARNVGLGLKPSLSLTAPEQRAVGQALAAVGIADLAERRPAELSGGQRQRAALARALLRRRPVLLLDEPLAALGPALRAEMLTLITRIVREQNMAALMITHAPEEARGFADLTALCLDARIENAQPTPDIFANPPPAFAAYLGTDTA